MSSPSPGYATPNLSTTVTSALDVPHSSVRRRASGSRPGPEAPTKSSEATDERDRYENPFDDAHEAAPQRKLPAPGRELFSDDEDAGITHMPPTEQDQGHPLPPNPTDVPSSDSMSPRAQGEKTPRLPIPNSATVRQSNERMDDINSLSGLVSKFTQPFKRLRVQSKAEDGRSNKADSSGISAEDSNPTTSLEGKTRGSINATEDRASDMNQASSSPAPNMLCQDAPNSQAQASDVSAPPDTTTIRLVHSTPSQSSIKDDHGESIIGLDEESTLKHRRPPRSPTLLAAIHGVTDRFTRRFPVSMSYRKANGRAGDPDDQHLLALLGYGETGAIVEWPNAWTPEKWSLLFSVCSVFIYGLAGLLLALMTWFGVWRQSIIIRIIDYDILVIPISAITSASLILLGTSIFGICGTLLNSRPLLVIYCILLWPSFIGMLVIGYSAYRRAAFALPNKLDQAWSQKWGDEDRMILQYSFHCCGYWSPEHEASLSPLCYPRTLLPGCKARVLHFERMSLRRYYTWVFSLVPLHVLNIVTAVLCSNHVNRLFGKGLTPWQYRLKIEDVRANALSVLETYRDTLIPPLPSRVYALRSRQFGDGTSRSPRIPQGNGDLDPQQADGAIENGWGRMPYEDSIESMFGFRDGGARGIDGGRAS
ncbi:hypothetical protein FRC12_000933 [Ceratobasidium sp. 428]|nr:hypothetical protein FRC12_000933 [Ceratobasidium sp. 428]